MTLKEMVDTVEAGKIVIYKYYDAKVYKDLNSPFGPYVFERDDGSKVRACAVWGKPEDFEILEDFKASKEPKWLPFKPGEMPEEYINYLYRRKEDLNRIHKPLSIITDVKEEKPLFLVDGWRSLSSLFNDWEVKINGKWQPVGVKEE